MRRDGPTVRLYTRNAYDWTTRLPAIAAAAARIKAKSFTIDGEAVVLGPDGLSRFDELRRREAAHSAMLYAFDLIEHDGRDLRDLRFSIGRPRWHYCCAVLTLTSFSMSTSRRRSYRVRARLPPRRRGHRVQESGRHLSIWTVFGLDQSSESRPHRGAAGAERELE